VLGEARFLEDIMSKIILREATQADYAAMQHVLDQNGLHAAGILTPGSRYWLAEDANGMVLGTVGLEYGENAVLLRSAAVLPDCQGQGIGGKLFAHAYAMAIADQRRIVYCFSTGAGEYWQRQGFYEVPVAELCAALPGSFQVRYYEQLGWLPTEVAWRRDI
jgi:N-acetylglutamate synthase-like GNAT family acetyltransferase